MKLNFKLLYALLIGAFLFTACSKEDITEDASFDAQENLAALEQELLTVEQWEDLEDQLENGRVIEEEDYLRIPDCVEKTWERIDDHTRKLTIDFGDTPCLGNDGLYRRGVIMITYSGPRGEVGSSKLTEFMAYFVMNIQFNGTKYVEFQGNHTYTRTVDMAKSIGDATSTWEADQVVEKIAGYLTEVKHDDIFQVTGSGSGVKKNGITYTADVTAPLLRKVQPGCHKNFVDGTILFVNENDVETLLDYDPIGGAPCDKLASITRNGNTHFITLW